MVPPLLPPPAPDAPLHPPPTCPRPELAKGKNEVVARFLPLLPPPAPDAPLPPPWPPPPAPDPSWQKAKGKHEVVETIGFNSVSMEDINRSNRFGASKVTLTQAVLANMGPGTKNQDHRKSFRTNLASLAWARSAVATSNTHGTGSPKSSEESHSNLGYGILGIGLQNGTSCAGWSTNPRLLRGILDTGARPGTIWPKRYKWYRGKSRVAKCSRDLRRDPAAVLDLGPIR